MKIPFYHVDAFTNEVFSGNPAIVCILDEWLTDKQLQLLASENYVPATAFLVKNTNGYDTRWFTPEYETDLCGHGSLASAHVIFTILEPSKSTTTLKYLSDELHVDNNDGLLTLQLPAKSLDKFNSDLLINGLGAQPKEVYQHKTERCLAVFDSEEEVRELKPDMSILKNLDHRGIIVTAKSENYDFISRTFYPRKSASEDAVTGSSHCLLVPYWANKLNKNILHTYQASHRGGELHCELRENKIAISGKATMYSQGVITFQHSANATQQA